MIGSYAKARQAGPGDFLDARPIVASRRRPTSPWVFVGSALFAATLLFLILNNAREARRGEPAASSTGIAQPESIPELVLPPDEERVGAPAQLRQWPTPYSAPERFVSAPVIASVPVRPVRLRASPSTVKAEVVPPDYYPPPATTYVPAPLAGPSPISSQQVATSSPQVVTPVSAAKVIDARTTILQGSTIKAVLESALDSTTPGQVRAMVTRDAYSADGTKVLVPRGSRLYGTYSSNLAQGQRRLQVRWLRLVRPDMVSINLDSPASDPLGRAGVTGRINSHFLQRLGNALLSSTFSLGSLLASRNDVPVIVAVPGGTVPQAVQQVGASGGEIRPTLTVRQGTRVSVFVQHDLDFAGVESGQ